MLENEKIDVNKTCPLSVLLIGGIKCWCIITAAAGYTIGSATGATSRPNFYRTSFSPTTFDPLQDQMARRRLWRQVNFCVTNHERIITIPCSC